MTNTKYTLNDLFFKKMKSRIYSIEGELDSPLDYDMFRIVMVDACNICNDEEYFDKERFLSLYNRYVDMFNKNKNDFSSLLTLKKSGHKDIMSNIIFGDMLPSTKCVTSIDYYINRCYMNAEDMLHKRQNQVSLDSYIRKYGDVIGREKYDEYVEKRKKIYEAKDDSFKEECVKRMRRISRNCVDHYVGKLNPNTGKKYTDVEISEEIKKHQRNAAKRSAEVIKKRNSETHDVTCRQVNFWMNKGYTYEESVDKVRKIQATNTVEYYVKKYGYEMGVAEYNDRNSSWGVLMRDLREKSGKVGNSYSKAATTLFETVIRRLSDDGIVFDKVCYGENEFSKWDTEYNRVYFYDFVINDIKLCVEYNGIMFHPKDGDYDWKCLFSGKSYDEVYAYDKRKQQLIKDFGYELIIVWEDDVFEKSVVKIVNVCKKLLKK